MSSVGRPPEVDNDGNTVNKCLVNVTIPTKLANFLKKKGINRSKLFRRCVENMYYGKLCDICYSDSIQNTKVGSYCRDCNGNPNKEITWLTLLDCINCGTMYQPPYNMFAQRKDSKDQGCWDCIPEKERA